MVISRLDSFEDLNFVISKQVRPQNHHRKGENNKRNISKPIIQKGRKYQRKTQFNKSENYEDRLVKRRREAPRNKT